MRQTWSDIVWCHWAVPAEQVEAILPYGLVPDLFEGSAWVGLVPFTMSDVRLTGPFGSISKWARVDRLGEVNVRTYVKARDGRTGVWFCTLDADNRLAVLTARVFFGLPYRNATTTLERSSDALYWSDHRHADHVDAEVAIEVVEEPWRPAAPGLESFLVERYDLFTTWCGSLLRGRLQHEQWRVRSATLTRVNTGTVHAAGFDVRGEPHVLVGESVHVSVYPLAKVKS